MCFIQIYLSFTVLSMITYYVPGVFAGLLVGLYFQFKEVIYQKFQPQFDALISRYEQLEERVLESVPRFTHPKDR